MARERPTATSSQGVIRNPQVAINARNQQREGTRTTYTANPSLVGQSGPISPFNAGGSRTVTSTGTNFAVGNSSTYLSGLVEDSRQKAQISEQSAELERLRAALNSVPTPPRRASFLTEGVGNLNVSNFRTGDAKVAPVPSVNANRRVSPTLIGG